MITANQLRAARALLSIDQRQMAELAGLSVPTIQRMEASDGVIRANVNSLMKLVSALESAGIELINPGAASATGGRGVRLREHVTNPKTIQKQISRQRARPSANRRGCWSGFDSVPHDVTAFRAFEQRQQSLAAWLWGQAGSRGMCRSTGTTSETPPTTA